MPLSTWAAIGATVLVIGLVGGGWKLLFDSAADAKELARNVLLAVLTVALGIPAGVRLNRYWGRIQDDERRRQLLVALRNAFEDNRRYIDEALTSLNGSVAVLATPPLDLVTLDATAATRYELLHNLDLARTIDRAHFELRHVGQRLEILHGRYQHMRFEASYQRAEALLAALRQWREVHGMRAEAQCRINADACTTTLNTYEIDCAYGKLGLINIAVGLTADDPAEQPRKPHLGGGAYGHCTAAIAAIDRALGNPVPATASPAVG